MAGMEVFVVGFLVFTVIRVFLGVKKMNQPTGFLIPPPIKHLICGLGVAMFAFPIATVSHAQTTDIINGPTGSPENSFLYANFNQARDILASSINAHGAQPWVENSVQLRAEFDGHYYNQAHYERPWTQHDYRIQGTLMYSAPLVAFLRQQTYDYDGPLESFTLLGQERGLALGGGNETAKEMTSSDLEESWREELEIFPQELLRQALAHPQSLRWLGSDQGRDVIQYQLGDGSSRTLMFDADTRLLLRMEHIDHWKLKGDRLEWVDFSQYLTVGGMQVAHQIDSHWEQRDTQADERLQLKNVRVQASIKATAFEIPGPYAEGHEPFIVSPLKKLNFVALPSHDLGHGVHIIDVKESNSRSMLVEFAGSCVIIEGGDHSAQSEQILKTVRQICPNKEVRYVAMSHHHPLYAGGIRTYVQNGITVLCTPGNVDYIRDLATRPYRIQPDAQQRSPREPIIEVIDKVKVMEDATQRLELHNFDSSLHTDEYVLTFVPALKLGFLGDIIYSPNEGVVGSGHGRTRAVYELIKGLDLNIEQLSQTCNLNRGKMLYPFSEIEAAALKSQEDTQR